MDVGIRWHETKVVTYQFGLLSLALDFGTNYLNFIKATELQQRLARSMADLAGRQKPEFIINTGDNVHFNGVDDTMDSRFELYYKASYSFAHGTRSVDILFIDTVILCGNSIDVADRSLFSWLFARRRVPNRPDQKWTNEAERQWKWIDQQLRDSVADYLFVVGYYPIYSITFNGNTQCLVEKLDPMLRKYQVSAYISGYDHNIQFFRVDNTTDPQATSRTYGHHSRHKEKFVGRPNYYRRGVSTMHYLVSGAGSRLDGSTANLDHVPVEPIFHFPKRHDIPTWKRIFKAPELGYGAGGFVRFEIRNDTADLYFYVRDLELQFLDYINRRPAIAELKDRRRKKTRKKSLV
ncbi:Tartrate-resistant acid phosphatase type 5 [Aphelenchoides besseyi]|nr:Tartrate-resistant acid phosphatase type 5 [Aphelenchoides besseyi]